MFHCLIAQHFGVCTRDDRNEIIELARLRENILEILPTKNGAFLILDIFWDSPPKVRNKITVSQLSLKR